MCVHSRARARLHGHEYDAHAQFRRNKRELSRRREKHQKTRRAQSDGAARARDGTQGEEEDARIEGESEIGRQKKRDAAGIKGEADKERLCEKPKEGERGRDINAVGEKRERKTTTREGRGDGGGRRRMYIKILFSDEIPGGARRHTARAYIFRPYINTRIIMNARARSLAPFSLPLCVYSFAHSRATARTFPVTFSVSSTSLGSSLSFFSRLFASLLRALLPTLLRSRRSETASGDTLVTRSRFFVRR